MRRASRHPLIVLLCALCLLGAQQSAYAHFLGHFGFAAETVARNGGDAEHGAATTLSHVCTTCAAFSAIGAAAPVPALPPPFAASAGTLPLPAAGADHPVASPSPYGARGPPAVL